MRSTRLAASGVMAFGCAVASAQTTWLVSNDPTENPDFPTISAAVASVAVVNGDTLLLSEGTGPYAGGIQVDRFLRFQAESGENPIITPGGVGTPKFGIRIPSSAPGISVDGVTFDGAGISGARFGVLTNALSPQTVVRRCTFANLSTGITTPGLVAECTFLDCGFGGSALRVEDSHFATSVPGSSFVSAPEVFRTSFTGPSQITVGGSGAQVRFVACRFENIGVPAGLSALQGGTFDSEFLLESCALANVTCTGVAIIDLSNSVSTLRNCTIVGCSAPALVEMRNSPGSLTLENSIIRGNNFATVFIGPVAAQSDITDFPLAGTNNIQTDPLFADPANGDYSLKRGSPAIDAGNTPLVPPGVTTDAAGNPRFADDPIMPDTGIGSAPVVDIGAFEFQAPGLGFCQADLTTGAIPGTPGYGIPNGIVNNDDFFYYLNLFTSELGCGVGPGLTRCPSPPDLTTTAIPATPGYGILDGFISNDDFFYYLTLFAQGC